MNDLQHKEERMNATLKTIRDQIAADLDTDDDQVDGWVIRDIDHGSVMADNPDHSRAWIEIKTNAGHTIHIVVSCEMAPST